MARVLQIALLVGKAAAVDVEGSRDEVERLAP